jgi:hypothetical protein
MVGCRPAKPPRERQIPPVQPLEQSLDRWLDPCPGKHRRIVVRLVLTHAGAYSHNRTSHVDIRTGPDAEDAQDRGSNVFFSLKAG